MPTSTVNLQLAFFMDNKDTVNINIPWYVTSVKLVDMIVSNEDQLNSYSNLCIISDPNLNINSQNNILCNIINDPILDFRVPLNIEFKLLQPTQIKGSYTFTLAEQGNVPLRNILTVDLYVNLTLEFS